MRQQQKVNKDEQVDFTVDELIELGFKLVTEGDTGYLELTDEENYINAPALASDDFFLSDLSQPVRVYKIGREKQEGAFDLYRINKFKQLLALKSITGV